jgi:hypothetical protein
MDTGGTLASAPGRERNASVRADRHIRFHAASPNVIGMQAQPPLAKREAFKEVGNREFVTWLEVQF